MKMFHKNLIKSQQISSSYLNVGKSLNLMLTRSKGGRNKYQGKKQQDFSKVVWEHKNVPDPETTDFEPGEFLPRRLTYMPEGLPQHRGKKIKWWLPDKTPLTININPKEREEWVDKPNYPPIVEMSTGFMRSLSEERESRLEFYRSLEKMPTFDQKTFEITDAKILPQLIFSNVAKFYDYLPLYKYVTKTCVIENELPSVYNTENAKLDELVRKLKPHLLNAIRNHLEFEVANPLYENKIPPFRYLATDRLKKDEALLQNINNVCLKQLVIDQNYSHLKESIVEFNSQINSWWWGNEFKPAVNSLPNQILKIKKINLSCLYEDYAPINIRQNEPLVPNLDQNDEMVNQEVPIFPTHPFKLGFQLATRRVSTFPGFYPPLKTETIEEIKSAKRGDFPFLSYLNREMLNLRNERNIDTFYDDDEVIQGMAVMHNFAYLNALANVHGFTTYSELTYPLTNQTIITNGQYWSFFVYQMNTHSFHSDLPKLTKQNLCWSVNNIKLYESYKDGKFEGVNDDVIKNLIKMYIQKPKLTEIYSDLRPHLGVDERSEEEKIKLREDMKRRFANYVTQWERLVRLRRKVHKFEWVYVRNPESKSVDDKIEPKLLKKIKDPWPTNKITGHVYEFSSDGRKDNKIRK